jgi:acetylornithine/succinyldiaminopimelate/putrescine aminotransferase
MRAMSDGFVGARALRQGYEAYREFVSPLIALRAELLGDPYQVAAAHGDTLVTLDGVEACDLIAGWGTQAFGHRPPHVVQALTELLASPVPTFSTSGVSPTAGLLAERLCARTGYQRAWFASGGTEAVEAALKLARAATGRPRVLYLEGAYHGCSFGSVSMMHRGPFRDPFAPHLPAVEALPFGDVAALAAALGPDVAAVVVEPVQVESGVRAMPPDYVAALGSLTARAGALLVVDEIQTGLGRTGHLLASASWPRQPDAVVLGKALGGGVVPLSALLTSRALHDAAYGSHQRADAHNSTFGGNALACVAGLAALDLLDEALLARVRAVGERFRAALADALAGSPLVEAVVGDGLLAGLRLRGSDHPWHTFGYLGIDDMGDGSAVAFLLAHRLFRAGWVTAVCGHNLTTLRLSPPLTIAEDKLGAFVSVCRREVEYLCQLA